MTDAEIDEDFDIILDDQSEIEFEYDPIRPSGLRLRTEAGLTVIHMRPLQVHQLFRAMEQKLRGY